MQQNYTPTYYRNVEATNLKKGISFVREGDTFKEVEVSYYETNEKDANGNSLWLPSRRICTDGTVMVPAERVSAPKTVQ